MSTRSLGHQHRHITSEDFTISHTDSPVMKSVENVQETETLSDTEILDSGPGIGPGVGRREARDRGCSPSASCLAPTPHHHSPVQPPIYPGVCLPTPGRPIPGQVISWIEEIAADEDGTDHLPEDAAQVFADTAYEVGLQTTSLRVHLISFLCILRTPPCVNQALNLPDLPPQLRRELLRALCRVCGRRALLPKSLQVPLCYNRLQVPQCRGGFADVWMGDHRGQQVAAKVLRVYLTSDFGKIRRVRHLHTTTAVGVY